MLNRQTVSQKDTFTETISTENQAKLLKINFHNYLYTKDFPYRKSFFIVNYISNSISEVCYIIIAVSYFTIAIDYFTNAVRCFIIAVDHFINAVDSFTTAVRNFIIALGYFRFISTVMGIWSEISLASFRLSKCV